MPAAENKALVHRLYAEGFNRQDAVAAARFYTADAINHGRPVGRAGMQRVFEALFATFPDFCYRIEDEAAEGAAWCARSETDASGDDAAGDLPRHAALVAPTGRGSKCRVPLFAWRRGNRRAAAGATTLACCSSSDLSGI